MRHPWGLKPSLTTTTAKGVVACYRGPSGLGTTGRGMMRMQIQLNKKGREVELTTPRPFCTSQKV